MNKIYINTIGIILFAILSCNKDLKVDNVSFDVKTASNTYHIGDTVRFMLSGNPDIISFYPGEAGHNYEYRDRTLAEGTPQMQFKSYERYGTHENTLHLLISKDFDGNYNAADIQKATWVDISDQATLSTGGKDTPSGVIDLSKYINPGESFYFAFRLVDTSGNGAQRTWVITDFSIDLMLKNGSSTPVANMTSAEWIPVAIEGKHEWQPSGDELKVTGGKPTDPDNDNWLISKSLNPNKVIPDRAIPIKDIAQKTTYFDYIYTEKGDYKVVFKAVNATADGEKTVLKTINLSIE